MRGAARTMRAVEAERALMSTENPDEEEERALQRPTPDASGGSSEVRTVTARDLLGARGIVRIEHEGETYTLRVTRNNRLILTK